MKTIYFGSEVVLEGLESEFQIEARRTPDVRNTRCRGGSLLLQVNVGNQLKRISHPKQLLVTYSEFSTLTWGGGGREKNSFFQGVQQFCKRLQIIKLHDFSKIWSRSII